MPGRHSIKIKNVGQSDSGYVDLWNGAPITTTTVGGTASLVVEIGPRDVACILGIH